MQICSATWFTGGPSFGKQTFINKFTNQALADNQTSAVLSINPTMRIAKETLLEDRIRFHADYAIDSL
jgi:putative protein kinase ArgK-like GTPase of G3E family